MKNISLQVYRKFLIYEGCKLIRTKGGHEHWSRKDLNRPITLQSHKSPVPEFIIKQHLRYLQLTSEEFKTIIKDL